MPLTAQTGDPAADALVSDMIDNKSGRWHQELHIDR
jgi:hypothetical protein